jgi:hypothetical protein
MSKKSDMVNKRLLDQIEQVCKWIRDGSLRNKTNEMETLWTDWDTSGNDLSSLVACLFALCWVGFAKKAWCAVVAGESTKRGAC